MIGSISKIYYCCYCYYKEHDQFLQSQNISEEIIEDIQTGDNIDNNSTRNNYNNNDTNNVYNNSTSSNIYNNNSNINSYNNDSTNNYNNSNNANKNSKEMLLQLQKNRNVFLGLNNINNNNNNNNAKKLSSIRLQEASELITKTTTIAYVSDSKDYIYRTPIDNDNYNNNNNNNNNNKNDDNNNITCILSNGNRVFLKKRINNKKFNIDINYNNNNEPLNLLNKPIHLIIKEADDIQLKSLLNNNNNNNKNNSDDNNNNNNLTTGLWVNKYTPKSFSQVLLF